MPLAPAIIGGLISGIGSLGSSLISNRGALERQNLANTQNMRFWDMQNKYNTPKNQMSRLKDAGLNPNLIYGSGSANTGVAGSIAPSKAAPYNIQNPIPLQAALLQSQINLNNSNANKNNVQADSVGGLLPGRKEELNFKNKLAGVKLQIQNQTSSAQIKTIQNSALQSDFNNIIKQKDSEEALKGNIKGNYIGTILNNLGLDSSKPEDAKIIKALLYGLIGSKLFNDLTGSVKNIIQSKAKAPVFNRSLEQMQILKK